MPNGGVRSAPFIPNLLEDLVVDAEAQPDDVLRDVPTLSGRADWAAWLQRVETLARLASIWEYVDPQGGRLLVEPIRPDPPVAPSFEPLARRRRNKPTRTSRLASSSTS